MLYRIGILLVGLFQTDPVVISYEHISLTVGWFLGNLTTLFSCRHTKRLVRWEDDHECRIVTDLEGCGKRYEVVFFIVSLGGVRESPLGTSATVGLLYQPRMIDYGAVGGMRIGRGNRSTLRKPAPVPIRPPQIPHDLTWDGTRAAAVGSQHGPRYELTKHWPRESITLPSSDTSD
jgi:hypothetical protein